MINKENKKWFLYDYLPKKMNKLFIYMPTQRCVDCDKYLTRLADYLIGRLDTIGKLTVLDNQELHLVQKYMDDQNDIFKFPLIVYEDGAVRHHGTNIVEAVARVLINYDLEEADQKKLMALKDQKTLL